MSLAVFFRVLKKVSELKKTVMWLKARKRP